MAQEKLNGLEKQKEEMMKLNSPLYLLQWIQGMTCNYYNHENFYHYDLHGFLNISCTMILQRLWIRQKRNLKICISKSLTERLTLELFCRNTKSCVLLTTGKVSYILQLEHQIYSYIKNTKIKNATLCLWSMWLIFSSFLSI